MSTEILTMKTTNLLLQEYKAEWSIKNFFRKKNDRIRTPAFAPFPENAIQFCFEMWYERKPSSNSIFFTSLMLIKLSAVDLPTTLEMKFNVKLKYYDGSLIKEYASLTPVSVHNMTPVTCVDFIEITNYGYELILECHIMHYGHLNTPSTYHREMRSLTNLKNLYKNFSAIYNPSFLSDVTIQIGDKSLQAHKAILVAHSPVIRKMMEHDFMESKTNTITITDSDYDTFDCFLKFLYSGEVEDKTLDTVKQLYILADKYDVQALKRECAAILVSTLTVDQACEVLTLLYDYDDDLKKEARCFAAVHFSELVSKLEWTELVKSHPQIGYDVLSVLYQPPQEMLANT